MPDPTASTSTLSGATPTADDAAALTFELARKERLANDHRELLFRFVLITVGASLLIVAAGVVAVGLGVLVLDTPVLVAFIAALAVQSFVLIGFLARGLFIEPAGSKTQAATVE